MMSSSDRLSLPRQSSLTPSQLRGLSSGEGSSRSSGEVSGRGGLTSSGHQVSTTDRRMSLDLSSSGPRAPGLQRTKSAPVLSPIRLPQGAPQQGVQPRGVQPQPQGVVPLGVPPQGVPPQPPQGPLAKLAHGLKMLFDRNYQKPEYKLPQSGVKFGEGDKGRQVGPYIIVGNKSKGVEPGFMAKKAWMPKDEANMLSNKAHKFYQRANGLLDQRLSSDLRHEGPLAAKANSFVWANHRDAFINHTNPDTSPSTLEEFLSDPANKGIRDDLLDHLKASDPKIKDSLRQHIMANEKKFTTLHMVKLDYVETDMTTRRGVVHVRIPEANAKKDIPFHREFTAQTRDHANRGAVRETMANDLMKAMGIHSQKLKLVQTSYTDGHPKLLLDGTFATGPQGGKFSDFDGHLKDGFIVKLNDKGEPIQKNGRYVLDTSINQLGRNKIFMLALADRDALGSKGGNKGFADNTFIGIDPGHSLEERLLGRTGDVHSDFSFDQPSMLAKKGYKNFSIFDQQPLSEKMEGVRKLKEMRDNGTDTGIFDDYGDKFDGTKMPGMDFRDEIGGMKALWVQRRDDILATFGERLAVDGFAFQKGADPARQKDLANKTLDILDNLEKLTSKTSDLSPKGEVQLERPRVIDRKAWNISQGVDNSIKMSFTGSSKQVADAGAKLTKFINETPALKQAVEQGMLGVRRDGDTLSFIIPHDGNAAHFLETIAAHFTNEAVMAHKHG